MPQLMGWLFQHAQLGLCKVMRQQGAQFAVEFVSGQRMIFSLEAIRIRALERVKLSAGVRCNTPGGECRIRRAVSDHLNEEMVYEVEYLETRAADVLPESALTPLGEHVETDPVERLASFRHDEHGVFREREQLLAAHARMLRQAGGLAALLSSRVDLRPHQAYVAGVILQDLRRRYILADEVGLGKTIEAGIVIHDLLRQNPKARILVLCPGSLATQWLSELYSKFGGYIFQVLDLAPAIPRASALQLVIVSTSKAAGEAAKVLGEVKWDMVVVDEAHHLLDWPSLYDAVSSLAAKAPSLLLLSAVPARRREDEYLKLLHLLEPTLYEQPRVRERFGELYAAQARIGAGLRVLTRRVDDFHAGTATEEDVRSACEGMLRLPVVGEDGQIASLVHEQGPVIEIARRVLHDVADRYRIHRRVLRNRRALLVEQGRLAAIKRILTPLPYDPEPREDAAVAAAHALVVAARANGLQEAALLPFARVLMQSACEPAALADVVGELDAAHPEQLTPAGFDYLGHGHLVGPSAWDDYLFLICKAVKRFIPGDVLGRALEATAAWSRSRAVPARRGALVKYLKKRRTLSGKPAKVIVFAGYPSVATALADALQDEFGDDSVARFGSEMEQVEKEREILRFRDSSATWILVCDESGGEGRNFQFASEIVHYDTPWHHARLEQRIGRLDRMGREDISPTVESVVLFARGTPEQGYVECASKAVCVYTESLSGLEFGLRNLEDTIAHAATQDEPIEAMRGLMEELRERTVEERARDDGDALLDSASYERRAAERYLRLARDAEAERSLERAFVGFFQCLGPRSVSKGHDESGHPLLRFDTHRLPPSAIALPAQASEGDGVFKGTFDRSLAQRAPRLQFMQVGNPLFDAVLESAHSMPVGRTYAVQCRVPDIEPWRGFEFVFRATTRPGLLDDQPSLALRANSVLDTLPVHVFVDGSGEVGPAGLGELRAGLVAGQRNVSWTDLTGPHATLLRGAFRTPFPQVLSSARGVALATATRMLQDRVEDAVGQELMFIADIERGIDAQVDADATDRLDQFRRYRQAITGWEVVLDAVGFLSVNEPLR